MSVWDLTLRALPGIGLIEPGQDLARMIAHAASADRFYLADDDVVVIASKAVSKAEGRIVDLAQVEAGEAARALAERTGRDARLCQLYLNESAAILRVKGRHVVTLDIRGFQGTSAGVDMSNVASAADGRAVLLPENPDASARKIRKDLRLLTGAQIAVIVSDSFGSPVRDGSHGAAVGIAGIRHLEQPAGERDLFGTPVRPVMNRVDEIASAASILMGETDQARPVVVVRGAPFTRDNNARLRRLLIKPDLAKAEQVLSAGQG